MKNKLPKMFRRSLPVELGQKLASYFTDLASMAGDGRALLYLDEVAPHRRTKGYIVLDQAFDWIEFVCRRALQSLPEPVPHKSYQHEGAGAVEGVPPPVTTVVEGIELRTVSEELAVLWRRMLRRERDKIAGAEKTTKDIVGEIVPVSVAVIIMYRRVLAAAGVTQDPPWLAPAYWTHFETEQDKEGGGHADFFGTRELCEADILERRGPRYAFGTSDVFGMYRP